MKKAIILTDLRILPLLTVCYLSTKEKDSVIIFSEYSLNGFDFGFAFPKWYNKIKIFLISILFNVKILKLEKFNFEPGDDEIIGILSSMVSMTNDSCANKFKYPILYQKLLLSYYASISIKNYLNNIHSLSELFIFNGRTASSEPLLRYFYYTNIKLNFYEYPLIFSPAYTLYDFPIHDNYKYGLKLFSFYKNRVFNHLVDDSNLYIKNKLNNQFARLYNIVNTIPKYDIVIFLGSDHELIFLNKEISNNIIFTNLELITKTIEKFGNEYTFAVRSHPNQRYDPSFLSSMFEIESYCKINNITFFPPDLNISSYQLILNCQFVVVGYSSIAEDAIYLGKKVFFMGNSDISAVISQLPSNIIENPILFKESLSDILKLRKIFLHHDFPFIYKYIFYLTFRIDILINKLYKYFIKQKIN
jgi:hypothetical protein